MRSVTADRLHPQNKGPRIAVRPGRFERPTPALGEWPEVHQAIDGDRTK